jgi:hypothetical protein
METQAKVCLKLAVVPVNHVPEGSSIDEWPSGHQSEAGIPRPKGLFEQQQWKMEACLSTIVRSKEYR